jgi:hypothetical protein
MVGLKFLVKYNFLYKYMHHTNFMKQINSLVCSSIYALKI